MNELKPCPFCGGKAELKQYRRDGMSIRCTRCVVKKQQRTKYQTLEWLEDKLITWWNARAPDKELEACCKLLIENGISTGHGDSFTGLIEECIANVLEIDPWRKIEYAPEGELVLVKIYIDQGMGHGHIEYKELTLTYGLFLPVPEGNIANVNFLAWQPIAEIPA